MGRVVLVSDTHVNKDLYELPEPICSDTLKYALIAGDIAKAKEEFENGAQIRVIVDCKHQTFAYWELMYEIVRQGRLESLKLLHERGFPLKDVLLRRHLFPTRNITVESYGYNEDDDDWPYEDAGDIHYRLIIEACKVGNLEMVKFLREVAKSSWSSNSRSEYHYPTLWYAMKMDRATFGSEDNPYLGAILNAYVPPQTSTSTDPSSSSSPMPDILETFQKATCFISSHSTALDYFESQILSHNMTDPMTDMPFSIYAAVNGAINVLKWMKSRGWSITEDRYEGGTISHYAMAAGHFYIMDWLCSEAEEDGYESHPATDCSYFDMTPVDWALARKIPRTTFALAEFIDHLHERRETMDLGAKSELEQLTSCVLIELEKIEWCDAPPMKLVPPISDENPSQCYSSYDRHDSMLVEMGLTQIRPFKDLKSGNLKNLKIAEAYEHLRRPIEDFLTYRDRVMVNMGEENHNIKRVERWAKQEKSFAERHAKSRIPSRLVVSDFVRRISIQSNFEVDFWNAFCTASFTKDGDYFRNFLILSQFAGVDMISASVETYKREWLEFEPCVKGAVAPLLELAAENPNIESPFWQKPRFPGVKRRQTSIFAVIARATPWTGKYFMSTYREDEYYSGWGTLRPFPDETARKSYYTWEHEGYVQPMEYSPLIWMFTGLLPTAKRVVAIVSEVFIEVALLGSIPMMEWLIDNCNVGDKTMDCYRMMMCQVAVFGTLNTLKWLHHRGFPLSFTPDDSGLRVEESCRFKTSEYMPVVPDAILLGFQERSMMKEKPIILVQKEKVGLPPIKLSRRPNFINATIALYPCYNFVRKIRDVHFCERIDFLVRNGVSLFEVDTHPDGDGWDASGYIHAYGYSFLVDHLKNGPFKADVSYKRDDKN